MIYLFDLDGTICEEDGDFENFTTEKDWHNYYTICKPIKDTIIKVRKLFLDNHTIIIWTARWDKDFAVTKEWLERNLVPFHKLIMDKPMGDIYVDANCRRPEEL